MEIRRLKRWIHARTIATIGAAIGIAAPNAADAQQVGWKPEKTVELVVPAAAGGGTDAATRVMQKILTDHRLVPQPTVVANKPGGGGAVAYTYMTQHKGDGHSLIVTYPSIITNHIVGSSALKHTDLAPIVQLSNSYIGFSVRDDSPLRSPKDLVDKLRADPGSVVFGTFAIGAGTHLAVAMAMKAYGVDVKKLRVVIFPSGAQSQTALLGGHVDVVPTGVANLVGPVKEGKIRILALTSPKRMEQFPKVPTWKESGADVVIGQWRGVMAPPGLSAAQIGFWEDVFARFDKTSEWRAALARMGDDQEFLDSREAKRFLDNEYNELARILNELGLAKQR